MRNFNVQFEVEDSKKEKAISFKICQSALGKYKDPMEYLTHI